MPETIRKGRHIFNTAVVSIHQVNGASRAEHRYSYRDRWARGRNTGTSNQRWYMRSWVEPNVLGRANHGTARRSRDLAAIWTHARTRVRVILHVGIIVTTPSTSWNGLSTVGRILSGLLPRRLHRTLPRSRFRIRLRHGGKMRSSRG